MIRKGHWARRILFTLFLVHGMALVWAITSGLAPSPDVLTIVFGVLNVGALVGLATRTRFAWFAALCFVAACVARYSWTIGVDDLGGLATVLAMAAAVLCVTDPGFRREHDIAV